MRAVGVVVVREQHELGLEVVVHAVARVETVSPPTKILKKTKNGFFHKIHF